MRPEPRPLAFDLVNEDGRRVRFQRVGDDITVHILGATGDRHMDVEAAKALVERLENRGFRRTAGAGEVDGATFFGGTQTAAPHFRLDGVTLRVRDMPGMTRFYRDVLGMELLEHSSEHAVFRVGTGSLYLEHVSAGEARATDSPSMSMLMTCRTDHVRADVTRMRQAGVRFLAVDGSQPEVSTEVVDTAWGLSACFADPEGNGWRLLERKG